ncbi:hypothetical protein EDD29_1887 [Actinocorallia herbida]|uniref:LemA protein n=1 Tax=Actinocorallia herbida TaxID=58109 RepID=A0A3N1CT12_9ACTN|nr:hypothetical protein [Actinocorallia herbida]ROO84365.1 hypothetical protein EDD29_1887 [Actinocorallia herbida]
MDGLLTLLLWLAALFLVSIYVSWRAGRLDRLHARVDLARAALDGALVRRAAVALELATSQLLDPATSLVLATAAHAARTADAEGREFAESDLSRALRAVVDQPGFHEALGDRVGPLLEELDTAAQKVAFARRFYNDAASATRIARRRILARVLPLAGHAPMPEFFEIDDTPPALG